MSQPREEEEEEEEMMIPPPPPLPSPTGGIITRTSSPLCAVIAFYILEKEEEEKEKKRGSHSTVLRSFSLQVAIHPTHRFTLFGDTQKRRSLPFSFLLHTAVLCCAVLC